MEFYKGLSCEGGLGNFIVNFCCRCGCCCCSKGDKTDNSEVQSSERADKLHSAAESAPKALVAVLGSRSVIVVFQLGVNDSDGGTRGRDSDGNENVKNGCDKAAFIGVGV